MGRIFITGSADGLGRMAAKLLVKDGHKVVLHARSSARAKDAMAAVPGAENVLVGDLSSIKETIAVAEEANASGPFTGIIYNAAIGYQEPKKILTEDGLPQPFAINSLAPYILTSLIKQPQRMVCVSSGLHRGVRKSLDDITWQTRAWNGPAAYSESKFHNLLLAFAVARKWSGVFSNAVEPGWVATKMGGAGAPDSLEEGPKTQAWLAASDSPEVMITGQYLFHQKLKSFNPAANDVTLQDEFLNICAQLSGIAFPG